jgi:glutamyl-tRNA synthetase
LRWLGLEWDEGPDVGGPHAIYRQQQRRAIYEEWLAKLDATGLTYPCFCTPAELNASRRQQLAGGKPWRYAGTCRALTEAQRCERLVRGQAAALRFKVPAGKVVTFVDLVHGEQHFASDDIGDFIIRRADGGTAFFFSNAIDDALMGVSLVLRGEDHLMNTPRQLLLLEAGGLLKPQYAHVALLLGTDGAPLSKRHGDLSLQGLRRRGFLPSAVRNHLVRLGHSCVTDGWLEDDAMIAEFDLARLGRAAARFDDMQLRHWQKEAVAHLSNEAFRAWTSAQLPAGLTQAQRESFITAVRHNVEFPQDAKHWAAVIFGKLTTYSDEAKAVIRDATPAFVATAADVFAQTADFNQAACDIGYKTNRNGPSLYMPLRAALTGETHGPELGPLLTLLTREEVQARLAAARRAVE